MRKLVLSFLVSVVFAHASAWASAEADSYNRPDCSGSGNRFTLVPVLSSCDLTDPDHATTAACKITMDGSEKSLTIGRPSAVPEVTVTSASEKCSKKFDSISSTWVDDSTNYPVTAGSRKYKSQFTIFVSGAGGPEGRFNPDHFFQEDTGLSVPGNGDRFSCVEDLLLNCGETVGASTMKFRKMRVMP